MRAGHERKNIHAAAQASAVFVFAVPRRAILARDLTAFIQCPHRFAERVVNRQTREARFAECVHDARRGIKMNNQGMNRTKLPRLTAA